MKKIHFQIDRNSRMRQYARRLQMHKEHHGFLYGVLAALTSSGMALFAKLSTSASVSMIVFVRFALGLPIILWVIKHRKVDISWKKVPKNLTRSLGSLLALYCYYSAVQMLPLVNAITLSNTAPLFVPFLALVWSKLIVSKRRFLGTAIGFLGVLILLQPKGGFLDWGSILGLASGFFAAIAIFSIRQLSKTESTEAILSYYFLMGAVVSFPPILFHWQPIHEPLQWLYLILNGLCALVFQFTATKAYTHAPATKVSTLNYLGVVFGGLFGWLIFNEVPNYWVLIGTVTIICGALIAIFDQTKSRPIGKQE